MKLRGEADLQRYHAVGREPDAAHDRLAREDKSLISEAAMPQLPDPRCRGRTCLLLIGEH